MASLPGDVGKFSRSSNPAAGYSLRAAVLGSIVLSLLAAALVAGAASLLHARHSVALELRTALDGARHTAEEALSPRADARAPSPAALTAMFRSDRHVQATVFGPGGDALAASPSPRGPGQAPAWFARLLEPDLAPVRLPLPLPAGALELRPDAGNEIAEVWTQAKDALLFLLTFSALGFLLVSLIIARTLRPLEDLSRAFVRLGEGRYDVSVGLAASREVRRLAEGFNAMVGRLVEAQARNARLEQQLLELQEEERADLAADLHDEIGPHLFAANMDAEAIIRLAGEGRAEAVVEPARAVRASVQHIQRHVRDMLRRLKPTRAVELGLEPALRELVAFWASRRDDIAFRLQLDIDDDALDAGRREALYRVAQEAVSNAVRHGRPRTVAISLALDADGQALLQVEDDGTGGAAAAPGGFGLAGMRQRMGAIGGELTAGPTGAERGWRVWARAPAA